MGLPFSIDNRAHKLGLIFALTGAAVLLLALFYLPPDLAAKMRFRKLTTLVLSARHAFFLTGSLIMLLSAACIFLSENRKHVTTICTVLTTILVFVTILVWIGTIRKYDVIGLAASSLRLATPIALGSLAGVMCERCGVVNIAIEGMMLTAACIGFTASLYSQSALVGIGAAVTAGGLMALLHAVLSIRFMVDQIVSGTVVNILAVGMTGFIRRAVLLGSDKANIGTLPIIDIPYLCDIPVIGRIFFHHQPLVYTMMLLMLVIHIMLFYTRWGLRTRTVGEHPRAADALGINVFRVRYTNVVIGGMIAGLGGAWFSMEMIDTFQELMTNGKGFIALAAMIFGKWCPFGAFGSAMLFGFADATQIKLQVMGVNIPYQFLGMLPYIITIIVLAGLIGRAVAPAADGIPYDRGS
ncbi:MAG: ABC transporter permease [Desulfobacterales bacterium]|nr:ABC transporter permease [Desulfobacterales bacterium]